MCRCWLILLIVEMPSAVLTCGNASQTTGKIPSRQDAKRAVDPELHY